MSGSCSMAELGRQLARMHLAEPAVRVVKWLRVLCFKVLCVRAGAPAGTLAPGELAAEGLKQQGTEMPAAVYIRGKGWDLGVTERLQHVRAGAAAGMHAPGRACGEV
jgi:hypothetical protein